MCRRLQRVKCVDSVLTRGHASANTMLIINFDSDKTGVCPAVQSYRQTNKIYNVSIISFLPHESSCLVYLLRLHIRVDHMLLQDIRYFELYLYKGPHIPEYLSNF